MRKGYEIAMNFVFVLSVMLKGIGALLEILLQIMITRKLGVSGYGDYSTWINTADLTFWVLFSGLVKCNTFYLSGRNVSIRSFKTRYYSKYVLPVFICTATAVFIFHGQPMFYFALMIMGLELFVYDQSSTLLARGQAKKSLIGEYVLGRLVLLAGVYVLGCIGHMKLRTLLILYVFQYVLVVLFFAVRKGGKTDTYTDVSQEVSLKKWGAYQWADLMYSMINQMPVVLQYFFAGAFEAGVVSIVLLVKKLINFISGPTAKIFLPEFSRMYRSGEHEKMREYYGSIMRLQMLFVGPLAVVLLAFPQVILKILAEELMNYADLFRLCSLVFLLTATLGPCGGILQMTGHEKMDNRCREISLIIMIAAMVLCHQDKLFVLYGLCAQAAFEAVGKYTVVCRWMKKPPVGLGTYVKWWILPGIVIAGVYLMHLQNSFLWMIFFAGLVFGIEGMTEVRKSHAITAIRAKLHI